MNNNDSPYIVVQSERLFTVFLKKLNYARSLGNQWFLVVSQQYFCPVVQLFEQARPLNLPRR